MKSITFTPPYGDEAIVAWLDGEMNDADAQRFESQLQRDTLLSARASELKKSAQDVKEAFALLLDEAPVDRMQARLGPLSATAPAVAVSPRAELSRRALIAASLSFLLIGTGLGYMARPASGIRDESENIRDLEAQYMSLYSTETLLDMDSSAPMLARGLTRTEQDLGLRLNEHQLIIQGAELKMVRILRYESTSIAQIAWVHADYGPMALCITPERADANTTVSNEQRHGMHLAWWNAGGYQFVLIGRAPHAQLMDTARGLRSALA